MEAPVVGDDAPVSWPPMEEAGAIYASSPRPRPDSDFEPGRLAHLAAGARGRLLDPRRTPVSVIEVRLATGFALIRIEDFEDAGAVWEVPLEQVDHYQFEPGGPRAKAAVVAEMEAVIRRFDQVEAIAADTAELPLTEARIADSQARAGAWLARHSRFLEDGGSLPDPSTRRGDPRLAADLEAYLRSLGLWDVEHGFSRGYVSNPGSGEIVKGHRMVLAELGLADYTGSVVRDPATFAGGWTRQRRADHIVGRLGFVRGLCERLGVTRVTLWRGLSTPSRLRRREGRTFVSTSFAEAVSRSHYQAGGPGRTRVLVSRLVPVDRLFMTYLETAAMNDRFREAEAVVLDVPADRWP